MNVLCSGSSDKTINVWDIKTGKALHTFCANGAVRALVVSSQGVLYSGSSDETRSQISEHAEANHIYAWNLKDQAFEELRTFKGHTRPVYDLVMWRRESDQERKRQGTTKYEGRIKMPDVLLR